MIRLEFVSDIRRLSLRPAKINGNSRLATVIAPSRIERTIKVRREGLAIIGDSCVENAHQLHMGTVLTSTGHVKLTEKIAFGRATG